MIGMARNVSEPAVSTRAIPDDAVAGNEDGSLVHETSPTSVPQHHQTQDKMEMSTTTLFHCMLLFRIFNALLVTTYFDPDEYWQSYSSFSFYRLEVAHRIVFGNGHLTWEWNHAIRGVAHPYLFAAVYWVLRALHLENTDMMTIAPKIMQSVWAALSDFYIYLLAKRLFGQETGKWTVVLPLTL